MAHISFRDMAINFAVAFAAYGGVFWLEDTSGIWGLLRDTVTPRLTLLLINSALVGMVVGTIAVSLKQRRDKRNRFTASSDG